MTDAIRTDVLRHPQGPDLAVRSFTCTVLGGPERGQTFALDATSPFSTLVGTGPACAIQLTDRGVSRRHLALELAREQLRVRDLGSTNGTRVSGVSIIEALLHGGEVIQLGDTTLRIDPTGERTDLQHAASFRRLLGTSRAMARVYAIARRLAASDVPTLIEGETGTGKELLAESIHDASARARGPFVVFDCTTISESLVESELFGHEKGAFTNAVTARRGVFEQAQRGTLFIDEIGDLDYTVQAKLLRAIERREVKPVGGSAWIKVDVRIIAATRRNLDDEVHRGLFRDDLYYRLVVGRIELPPLRAREGDIAFLARAFWAELGGHGRKIPDTLLKQLEQHPWPGNVRELQNFIARIFAVGDSELSPLRGSTEASGNDFVNDVVRLDIPIAVGRQRVIDEYERRYVARVLEAYGGHVGKASAASGISRRYFQQIRNRVSERGGACERSDEPSK